MMLERNLVLLNLLLQCMIVAVVASPDKCDGLLSKKLIAEIKGYKPIADRIMREVLTGRFQNATWNDLADFGDTFGNRLAGTENLENAIDYILQQAKNANLDNVHGEKATVPYWKRGLESAELLTPKYQKIAMLGLGSSVGTPEGGITAQVVVFSSFEDMAAHKDKVPGKIVVFNQKYVNYGVTVQYRSKSASKASIYGAVAVLISSVTPFSLNTPHTGGQDYDDNVKKIPAACITPADANMLARMVKRGSNVTIKLEMGAENLPPKRSRNVIFDLTGSQNPESLVIVSGHIDSWDVGQGVVDDGAGAFLGYEALRILKTLGYHAKRTIRGIMWTAEEEGYVGARQYFKTIDPKTINFIMESDEGTFTPIGFNFAGTLESACVFQEIQKLLKPINVNKFNHMLNVGSDIELWTQIGVPGASINTDNGKYFYYHHTDADTMDAEDPQDLDKCTASWAIVAYVIADLSIDMPKQLNVL